MVAAAEVHAGSADTPAYRPHSCALGWGRAQRELGERRGQTSRNVYFSTPRWSLTLVFVAWRTPLRAHPDGH